jgi:hypothetical protein
MDMEMGAAGGAHGSGRLDAGPDGAGEPAARCAESRDAGPATASRAGIGLAGLADRIAALEGELTITSPPGAGTAIHAEIPLG